MSVSPGIGGTKGLAPLAITMFFVVKVFPSTSTVKGDVMVAVPSSAAPRPLASTVDERQVMDYLQLRGGYKLNYSGIDDDKVDEVTGVRFEAPRTEEGLTFGAGVSVPWQDYHPTIDYPFASVPRTPGSPKSGARCRADQSP